MTIGNTHLNLTIQCDVCDNWFGYSYKAGRKHKAIICPRCEQEVHWDKPDLRIRALSNTDIASIVLQAKEIDTVPIVQPYHEDFCRAIYEVAEKAKLKHRQKASVLIDEIKKYFDEEDEDEDLEPEFIDLTPHDIPPCPMCDGAWECVKEVWFLYSDDDEETESEGYGAECDCCGLTTPRYDTLDELISYLKLETEE